MTYLSYNWKSVPLNHLHLFLPTPTHLPAGNQQLILHIYDSVFFLFCFLDFTYKGDHMVFVFLCLTNFTSSIHVVTNGKIVMTNSPLYIQISHFIFCASDIAFFFSFFFFKQIEGLWQPCIYWSNFSNSIYSLCVFMSHFDNSCNISNFFIIFMVTCDQWSLMLLL